jgi:hypothetical protein
VGLGLQLRFPNNTFLRGGVVSLTPNPQPGGPGYPFLSGSSPLTCLAREALPVAYTTASIALGFVLFTKHYYNDISFLVSEDGGIFGLWKFRLIARTTEHVNLRHYDTLWNYGQERAALMLCIQKVSNSNYGRGTVYQENFVVWLSLSRKTPRRYLKFAYDRFPCTFFSRHYSPTMQSYSPRYRQRREVKYVPYVYTQASLTTLIYV